MNGGARGDKSAINSDASVFVLGEERPVTKQGRTKLICMSLTQARALEKSLASALKNKPQVKETEVKETKVKEPGNVDKVFVLGRWREVIKEAGKYYVIYNGNKMALEEAEELQVERMLKQETKMKPRIEDVINNLRINIYESMWVHIRDSAIDRGYFEITGKVLEDELRPFLRCDRYLNLDEEGWTRQYTKAQIVIARQHQQKMEVMLEVSAEFKKDKQTKVVAAKVYLSAPSYDGPAFLADEMRINRTVNVQKEGFSVFMTMGEFICDVINVFDHADQRTYNETFDITPGSISTTDYRSVLWQGRALFRMLGGEVRKIETAPKKKLHKLIVKM